MLHALGKENFFALAKNKQYVLIYKELLADIFTPISAFENLIEQDETAMLLESGLKFNESGSYSFIGVDPYASFETKNGVTHITHATEQSTNTEHPLSLLRKFHQNFSCIQDEHSQLLGHMVGFLAYDAVRYFEEIPDQHTDDASIPDILFHFYRINLVFNHDTKKLLIGIIVNTENPSETLYENTLSEIDALITRLQNPSKSSSLTFSDAPLEKTSFQTDCEDEDFEEKVRLAKKFIHAGDVFQLVLSRTFSKPVCGNPLSIYRILRHSNPTPYLFYLKLPQLVLLGASPEKVVSLEDRTITIAPIAGTVPTTHESTEILLQKLRDDPKERAEHMMLVDLARNDIGAVCEPGSVYVADLMMAERLTYVTHLVSYVKGILSQKCDVFDLLKSAFPAGTLTGAPKIRAMNLIDQLESSKRHLYGGAICKIDSKGNLDSCIVIRSGVIKEGVIKVRAGAGIVFDSDPATEAEETRNKAKGVFKSIMAVEGAV